MYNENGELIRDVILPKNIYACHAKELIDGTIVVCHLAMPTASGQPPGHMGISQFSVSPGGTTSGRLRAFSCDAVGDVRQSSTPFHLDASGVGNVLLIDRSKCHVVLLRPTDKSYQALHLLLSNTVLHPKRMSYNDNTKLLCVCYYDMSLVKIYKV
jgi:hypothetical protein